MCRKVWDESRGFTAHLVNVAMTNLLSLKFDEAGINSILEASRVSDMTHSSPAEDEELLRAIEESRKEAQGSERR